MRAARFLILHDMYLFLPNSKEKIAIVCVTLICSAELIINVVSLLISKSYLDLKLIDCLIIGLF